MAEQRLVAVLSLGLIVPIGAAARQNPPQTERPSSAAAAQGKEHSHEHDFLVRGTVFTNTAYALAGVQIRLRRAGEKKYRWETYTNSRGEFALRVPQGADYELQVHGKGFADQTRTIDAKAGNLEEGITFQMQPLQSKPSGGKT